MRFAILPSWFFVAVFVALLVAPGFAFDRFGTAGPIRTFGDGACALPYQAIRNGECDPPPVDTTLLPEQRSAARIERAKRLIRVPRVEEAVKEMDRALVDNPQDVSALLLRARLQMPGHADEARKDLNALLRIDPDNSDALATRALLLMSEDVSGALREASKAVSANPGSVDALWIRAIILRQVNSYDEAESDLTAALALEPDNLRLLLSRSQVRMQLGKSKEAEDDATAILAVDQHNFAARQLRAVVRAKSGRYDGALDDLNQVLGKPGEPTAFFPDASYRLNLYVQRALVSTKVGKRDDAKRDFETIVSQGGIRAILQMQLYLRHHGFPDVKIDGKRTDGLDDALQACFINDACGRGLTLSG